MENYPKSEDGVRSFIKEQVKKRWDDNKSPYRLSDIVTDFRKFGDLKAIIGGKQLKAWLSDKESDLGVKVLTHPTVKARVVIVPDYSDYSFDEKENKTTLETKKNLTNKEVTILFLGVLGSLPQHDLEDIHIPAKIIAKLMR